MVLREAAIPQVKLKKKREIIEVVSGFKYLGNCFSKIERQQEDVKMGLSEGLIAFGAMKVMFNVRRISFCVKRKCMKYVV